MTRVMYEIWGLLYEIHFLVQFHTMRMGLKKGKNWDLGGSWQDLGDSLKF